MEALPLLTNPRLISSPEDRRGGGNRCSVFDFSARPSCPFRSGWRSSHNIPQARYRRLPVISRSSSSATRSWAARGVTLSSRAINPADRIGRAMTSSTSAGRLEFERRPTNLRSSRRRASSASQPEDQVAVALARPAQVAQLVPTRSALCCRSRASFGPDLASTSAEPAPGDPA
jgi:hypothetical protein